MRFCRAVRWVAIGVALAAAGATPRAGSPPAGPPPGAPLPADPLRAGLDLLHQGLFESAEASFAAAAAGRSDDPEPHLLIAFSYLWRIFQDRGDTGYDAPYRAAIEAVVERASRRLAADPADAAAQAALGSAYVFDFCVQGLRHNYLRAAQAARRGHKLLEAAVARDPSLRDPLFALGGYNYFADRVPAIARGLLFIPRGNADVGLGQLRTVASSQARFHSEARLLLALICGSREEHCYLEAERHLRVVLADYPESPLILASIGNLKMRLGYYPEAAALFEEALAAARGESSERAGQRRTLRLLLAEADVADWRLDAADAGVVAALAEPGTAPPRDVQAAERLRAEIRQKRGTAGWRTEEGLRAWDHDRHDEALSILQEAAEAHPLEPLPRFLRGRMLFLQGRYGDADKDLAAAASLGSDHPLWMDGWIALYRGLALRNLGEPDGARDQFTRAAGLRRFRSSERGSFELRGAEPEQARCAL